MDEFERTLQTDHYLGALSTQEVRKGHPFGVAEKDFELMTEVLVSVIYEVTRQVRVRDEWETATAFEHGAYPKAFRKTKKTGLEISLTICLDGIFFECDLPYGYMLSSLDDRFWRTFVELILDYGGKYDLDLSPRERAMQPEELAISRARKSAVFSTVADFVLASKDPQGAVIGDLTFRFDWTGKWASIVPTVKEITVRAWKMSYMLYRRAYERRKAMEKRVIRKIVKSQVNRGGNEVD